MSVFFTFNSILCALYSAIPLLKGDPRPTDITTSAWTALMAIVFALLAIAWRGNPKRTDKDSNDTRD
jgi:hypothetical protein